MASLEQSPDTIFLVHPADGNLDSLELLVSKMEATVFGIEGVINAPLQSVQALAGFYITEIKQVQPQGPYKLAGYSIGGTIAFEMALQLEEEVSAVDSLLMLDSCPKWGQIIRKYGMIKGLTVDTTSCLIHFAVSHSQIHREQVAADIMRLSSWDEKVDFVAQLLNGSNSDLSKEDIKDMAKTFSYRHMICYDYEPSKKIHCRVMLIKCVDGIVNKHLAEDYDYGLYKYCHSPPEVQVIQGTHHSFIDEPLELGIPKIINQMYRAK